MFSGFTRGVNISQRSLIWTAACIVRSRGADGSGLPGYVTNRPRFSILMVGVILHELRLRRAGDRRFRDR